MESRLHVKCFDIFLGLNFQKDNKLKLRCMVDSPVAELEAALITGQRLLVQRETPAVFLVCCTLSLRPSHRTETHPNRISEKQTCHDFHRATCNWWLCPHFFFDSRHIWIIIKCDQWNDFKCRCYYTLPRVSSCIFSSGLVACNVKKNVIEFGKILEEFLKFWDSALDFSESPSFGSNVSF